MVLNFNLRHTAVFLFFSYPCIFFFGGGEEEKNNEASLEGTTKQGQNKLELTLSSCAAACFRGLRNCLSQHLLWIKHPPGLFDVNSDLAQLVNLSKK